MSAYSYMKLLCPICGVEFDGLKAWRQGCCGRECLKEWDWRRSLAILGETYVTQEEYAARKQGEATKEKLGTPISELSGRPGRPGYGEFCRIAESWGHV